MTIIGLPLVSFIPDNAAKRAEGKGELHNRMRCTGYALTARGRSRCRRDADVEKP